MFYILRWFVYLCRFFDGCLGLITFGFWDSGLSLMAESLFLDYKDEYNKRSNKW